MPNVFIAFSNKGMFAALAKVAAAFVAFLLTVVSTRILGAEESGLFLLGLSLLSVLVIIFRLGLDNIVLRLVAGGEGTGKNLSVGLSWVFLVSVPFAILVSVFSDYIATVVFGKPQFSSVLGVVVWAAPFMSIFTLLGMAFQGQYKVVLATLFQNLGVSSLFLAIFIPYSLYSAHYASADMAVLVYLIASVALFVLGVFLWFRQPGVVWRFGGLWDVVLWKASSNLWVASIMSLAVIWSGVLVAGAFLPAQELAYLSAAQRTAALISFVLVVVNMVVAPRYAKLWVDKKLPEIKKLSQSTARAMLLVVLPLFFLIIFYSDSLMALFGVGFEQGAFLLVVMCCGQLVNVATGSVNYLLTMTGHEEDYRRVTMFSGPLSIFLALFFTAHWGGVGAASATALGLALQNVGGVCMVRRRLGFWPLG